jgi:hypothetical protein
MPVPDYAATYSELSNDEILRLACEASGLREEARVALNAELGKRKLTAKDVSEYEQLLASMKPGEMAANQSYTARSFQGLGTATYGKRDFHSDGSFTTTKWFVFCWVPVYPIESLRLGKPGPRLGTGSPGLSKHYLNFFPWDTHHWVYSRGSVNQKQAVFIYSFLFALALALWNAAHKPTKVSLVLICLLCTVPWLLRELARTKVNSSNDGMPPAT